MRTPNGDDWFLYHAYRWNQVEDVPGRVLCLDKIRWNKYNDWPYIGTPSNKPTLAPNVINSLFQ